MFTSNLFAPGETRSVSEGGSWVSSLFGGGSRARSGATVDANTAMQVTAVQACVTLLAESIAQLPCDLYRREKGDQRKRATDHPLYDVLRYSPNGWQTSFEYQEQKQNALGLRGNSFNYIDRSPQGHIQQLIPLMNDKVQPLRGEDGMPYYKLLEYDETVPMRLIHHTRWHSSNGYVGLSPIDLHRNSIGLHMSVEEHAETVFSQGTTLSGVIERPTDASPLKQDAINRIKDGWKSEFSGSKNAFKIAMLQEGMKYNQMGMTNEDAQLLASRNYGVNEIARIWKIPLHMVQHLEKATFSNIEHQGIQYVIYTLMPWIKRHEQAMMRDFLTAEERKKYYIEFNVSGLLRGDQKSRYDAYAIARQWGWLSVNDIRRLENMPPVSGGDTYLQPLNMVDAANPAANVSKEKIQQIEAILK